MEEFMMEKYKEISSLEMLLSSTQKETPLFWRNLAWKCQLAIK